MLMNLMDGSAQTSARAATEVSVSTRRLARYPLEYQFLRRCYDSTRERIHGASGNRTEACRCRGGRHHHCANEAVKMTRTTSPNHSDINDKPDNYHDFHKRPAPMTKMKRDCQRKMTLILDVLYHTVPHELRVMNSPSEYSLKYFDHILLEPRACSSCTFHK